MERGEGTAPYLREGIPPLNTALCPAFSPFPLSLLTGGFTGPTSPPPRNYDEIAMDQSFSQSFHCNP